MIRSIRKPIISLKSCYAHQERTQSKLCSEGWWWCQIPGRPRSGRQSHAQPIKTHIIIIVIIGSRVTYETTMTMMMCSVCKLRGLLGKGAECGFGNAITGALFRHRDLLPTHVWLHYHMTPLASSRSCKWPTYSVGIWANIRLI